MDTVLLLSFAPILFLLVLGAFFAGSETALTAVSRGRMHQLEKEGSRAARDVNRLVNNRERMVGALLLGNTFVNILASSLATIVLENSFGHRAVLIRDRGDDRADPVLRRGAAQGRSPSRAPTASRWPSPRRCASWSSCWRRSSNAVQYVVWRVLGLFGVRENEEDLVEAHEEIRAPSTCTTRKARWSASIAT